MKRLVLYFSVAALVLLMQVSCGGKTGQLCNGLSFDSMVVDTSIAISNDSLSPCGEMHLAVCYAEGPNAERINDSILASGILSPDFLPQPAPQTGLLKAIKAFKKTFSENYTKDYKDLYRQYGSSPSLNVFYNVKSKQLQNRPDVVSLIYEVSRFDGGAHGQELTYALNFNTKSGEQLKLTDYVSPLKQKAFLALVLNKLSKQFGAKGEKDLKGRSVFAFSDPYLPKNFIVERDGLTLVYQMDEIAAHAMGEIRVKLSGSELKAL